MTLIRKAVLEDLKIEKNGILIEEIPFVSKLNLRGNPKDKEFLRNTGSILEVLIPLDPNTKIQNKKFQVIWLSPNEWLISFFNNEIFIKTLNKLNSKLNPKKTSITDVSENKTIIRVEGNNVNQLLRKFIILDIENILPNNSRIAQTIFVKIPILIIRNHPNEIKKSYD
ncbi:sarcosine oxidase subunit gamma family protein, partial [Alphaproteobacteria bacterium]|nr:sarcosine oxidase subunit gamma family protein [Alphaproteobacteria bacterium]